MKRNGEAVDDGEFVPDTKKQRVLEQSSPSSSSLVENPLHQLTAYDDIDYEEDVTRGRLRNGYQEGVDGYAAEQNGRVADERGKEEDDSESDDEQDEEHNKGRRGRLVEIRRDCPYLDTVNRQVL